MFPFRFSLTYDDDKEEEEVDHELPDGGPHFNLPVHAVIHVLGGPQAVEGLQEREPAAFWNVILSFDDKGSKILFNMMTFLIFFFIFRLFILILNYFFFIFFPSKTDNALPTSWSTLAFTL